MRNYLKIIILSALAATAGCTPILCLPSSTYYHLSGLIMATTLSCFNQVLLWNIDGAFSIQQHGKPSSPPGYEWQQKGTNYHIRIHSILGIDSVEISGRLEIVMLWLSPQEHYTAHTSE